MTVKVNVNHSTLKRIVKDLDNRENKTRIANLAIEQMVYWTKKGKSPIKGRTRFAKYSDLYKNRIKRGDYKKYSKRARPVNLHLTGEMLSSLKSKFRRGTIEIGIFNAAMAKRAILHQRGGKNEDGNYVPQRRFIPSKNGEEFITSIQRLLKNEYVKIIDSIIRNS